jgi:hypothetical protein
MAWTRNTDYPDALETKDGAFLAVVDPVYNYYSLRSAEDPDTSLAECATLAQIDAAIARIQAAAPTA